MCHAANTLRPRAGRCGRADFCLVLHGLSIEMLHTVLMTEQAAPNAPTVYVASA
jgi:hypothetical protein